MLKFNFLKAKTIAFKLRCTIKQSTISSRPQRCEPSSGHIRLREYELVNYAMFDKTHTHTHTHTHQNCLCIISCIDRKSAVGKFGICQSE